MIFIFLFKINLSVFVVLFSRFDDSEVDKFSLFVVLSSLLSIALDQVPCPVSVAANIGTLGRYLAAVMFL